MNAKPNKYLQKIAETIDPESLTPEQLTQLFTDFQQLPADAPTGKPGSTPFYGSVKLSEGVPGKREHRNTAYGNSTPVEGNNADEYRYEFQRAFPRG